MSIEKISDAARDAASVGALADRPQATERDGYSGMTPAQLKAAFDALPKLNTAKINEIIDLINGESTESLAYLLQTPVEYQGDTMTLYEFLAAVQGGSFGDIAMIGSRTLSAAIDHAAGEVFDTKMAGVTADATTLAPGSPATASYNNSTKKFTFGIPKGDPGSGGGGGEVKAFYANIGNLPTSGDINGSFRFSEEDWAFITDTSNYHAAGTGDSFTVPAVIFATAITEYPANSEKDLVFTVYHASMSTLGTGKITIYGVAISPERIIYNLMITAYATNINREGSFTITQGEAVIWGSVCAVINNLTTLTDRFIPSAKAVKTSLSTKENAGKIKISSTEYTVTRKALTITENGVTTTYYVADIT